VFDALDVDGTLANQARDANGMLPRVGVVAGSVGPQTKSRSSHVARRTGMRGLTPVAPTSNMPFGMLTVA